MNLSQLEIDLYREMILDHNRKPRNFRGMSNASHESEGYNPLCGDRLHVYIKTDVSGLITDISFEGSGCAISKASASMMTEVLMGKNLVEVRSLFEDFLNLITGVKKSKASNLGKLKIFSGVCRYPTRVKCAGLAWHTMHGALADKGEISTESGEDAL